MAAATLITLEMAKWQVKETGSLRDAEITLRMAHAEDVILRFLKPLRTDEPRDDGYPWTIDTVPPAVQDAILLYLAHLDRNHGDAIDKQDVEVWDAIVRRTAQLRDKALA